MTVEERMQTIRVWNMVQRHPEFAREIGLTWYVNDITKENKRVEDINTNQSEQASECEAGTALLEFNSMRSGE